MLLLHMRLPITPPSPPPPPPPSRIGDCARRLICRRSLALSQRKEKVKLRIDGTKQHAVQFDVRLYHQMGMINTTYKGHLKMALQNISRRKGKVNLRIDTTMHVRQDRVQLVQLKLIDIREIKIWHCKIFLKGKRN